MKRVVEFAHRHPLHAARNCDDCQSYRLETDAKTGTERICRDGRGLPILNENPPKCDREPCACAKPWGKPMFTPVQRRIFDRYRVCRAMRALPRAGGIDDQNPLEMRFFVMLRQAEEAREFEAASKAGPLGLLMALPMLGR